jgi:hypothetical protein
MKPFLPLALLLLCTLCIFTGCGLRPSKTPGAATVEVGSAGGLSDPHAAGIGDPVYDPDHYVVIRTAEDLMAFQRAVNRDGYSFAGMTVVFLNDIDMRDYTWEPLDGACLVGVTFDGRGHTVSRLRLADYEYPPDTTLSDDEKGCGLIGVATGEVIFRDLTLAYTTVKAYDHSVGNFVGSIRDGRVTFTNCASVGFTAEGWMDWFSRDPARGGHAVAMRLGGFVGYVGEGGEASFRGCAVEDLTLSGFHNLAAFVGYDGGGALDAACFSDCSVTGAHLTFSYCLAEGFTANQPTKFVSVFYNSHDWRDTTAACIALGSGYTDVYFYDWADDGAVYTPDSFRSYPEKEADPS